MIRNCGDEIALEFSGEDAIADAEAFAERLAEAVADIRAGRQPEGGSARVIS